MSNISPTGRRTEGRVDQNQCKHIYSIDPVENSYGELGVEVDYTPGWGEFVCEFCPRCGKDLRKENKPHA